MNCNQNEKISQVKFTTLVVGIDIGSTTHYANNGFNNGNILLLINNISDAIKKNNKESLSEVPDEEK